MFVAKAVVYSPAGKEMLSVVVKGNTVRMALDKVSTFSHSSLMSLEGEEWGHLAVAIRREEAPE